MKEWGKTQKQKACKKGGGAGNTKKEGRETDPSPPSFL